YDIGEWQGAPYIVSELLAGETLRDRLKNGPIPARKTVDYALQVTRGLAAAHARGIIHRDLKPENIFLTQDGRVKILDFGLAKLTQPEATKNDQSKLDTAFADSQPGTVLGTIGYMSPEQVRGQTLDHRSDIFSLGAILYEMLSGTAPFRRETSVDTMSAILHQEPPVLSKAGISPAFESLIRHCLEKNPEERFQSARDLAFDLQMISGQSASATAQVKAVSPNQRSLARDALTATALLAATAIGIFAGMRFARHSQV